MTKTMLTSEKKLKSGISLRKRPGLWENIRRKKKRMGKNYKPAKTEKEGRPSQEELKKAQSAPRDP